MKPQTQSEVAFEGLRKDILECRLLPSSKIKINDVCASYGVSLSAAREALSRLTAVGMVRMEMQKGFTVAPISWKEFAYLTEARIEIETLCLAQSIAHGDVEWETQVAGALHRLTRLLERDTTEAALFNKAWLAAHATFHQALVAACPNGCLLELREMLYMRSERYRHWAVSLCLAYGRRDLKQEHIDLAQFALARDSRAAIAAIREHFILTSEDLLAAVREAGADSDDALPPRPRAASTGASAVNASSSRRRDKTDIRV